MAYEQNVPSCEPLIKQTFRMCYYFALLYSFCLWSRFVSCRLFWNNPFVAIQFSVQAFFKQDDYGVRGQWHLRTAKQLWWCVILLVLRLSRDTILNVTRQRKVYHGGTAPQHENKHVLLVFSFIARKINTFRVWPHGDRRLYRLGIKVGYGGMDERYAMNKT